MPKHPAVDTMAKRLVPQAPPRPVAIRTPQAQPQEAMPSNRSALLEFPAVFVLVVSFPVDALPDILSHGAIPNGLYLFRPVAALTSLTLFASSD